MKGKTDEEDWHQIVPDQMERDEIEEGKVGSNNGKSHLSQGDVNPHPTRSHCLRGRVEKEAGEAERQRQEGEKNDGGAERKGKRRCDRNGKDLPLLRMEPVERSFGSSRIDSIFSMARRRFRCLCFTLPKGTYRSGWPRARMRQQKSTSSPTCMSSLIPPISAYTVFG